MYLYVCCAGDPIEMGAVAAVLLSSKSQQQTRSFPLTIASDKSGIGHTEPAAGMSGLVHAAAAVASQAALPVLHLRALNPYLIGTLEAPGVAGTLSIPRQQRGAVVGQHPAGSITGISSFAFQVKLTASQLRAFCHLLLMLLIVPASVGLMNCFMPPLINHHGRLSSPTSITNPRLPVVLMRRVPMPTS